MSEFRSVDGRNFRQRCLDTATHPLRTLTQHRIARHETLLNQGPQPTQIQKERDRRMRMTYLSIHNLSLLPQAQDPITAYDAYIAAKEALVRTSLIPDEQIGAELIARWTTKVTQLRQSLQQ